MGDLDFLSGLGLFINTARDSNTTEEECESSINHYLFYQYSLIPACVLTCLMAATKARRRKLLSFLNGRPGLIFPMDTLTRSSRISYCCAFGATGFLVYQILIDGKFAVDYTEPMALKTLIAMISMFIYGMVFFPVFTSLALGTAFSYLLGSLYVWMFFIVEIYKITECDFNVAGRAVLLTRALPSLICLGYLSLSMPVKFCLAIHKKNYFTPSLGENPYTETVEQIKQSYQGKHVKRLLRKPEIVKSPEGVLNIIKTGVTGVLVSCIYQRQSGFRYPSRMISVMFVAGCVVYVITVQLLVTYVTLLNMMLDILQSSLELLGPESETEDGSTATTRIGISFAYYLAEILKVSLIISVTLSCVITVISIIHMMSSFRTNLYALYRGDYSHIPPPYVKSAISLCTGSIKYAGFQVAYIVWAYVIIAFILFIFCMILAVIVTLFLNGFTEWMLQTVLQVWPGVVIGLGLFVAQWLLAKFFFLQDRGQHLRLDNRRFYFVFVYFMFFFNIFLGLVSCLMRIIKAIGVGTIFMARLDNSTLPRKFEFFDPGFSAYQGYIHMEVAHTHPVVNVFIRLLVALSNSRNKKKSDDREIEMCHLEESLDYDNCKKESSTDPAVARPGNVAARFHWHVTYTLLHNPTVRIYRKGFIQCMKKARKEGFKVPISDMPITDFDLVKTQEERDEQRTACLIGGDKDGQIHTEQTDRKSTKCRWLKKWRKRSGSETFVALETVSEDNALGNNIESYVKHENV